MQEAGCLAFSSEATAVNCVQACFGCRRGRNNYSDTHTCSTHTHTQYSHTHCEYTVHTHTNTRSHMHTVHTHTHTTSAEHAALDLLLKSERAVTSCWLTVVIQCHTLHGIQPHIWSERFRSRHLLQHPQHSWQCVHVLKALNKLWKSPNHLT